MPIDQEIEDILLLSIKGGRLVLLCGAGLSMAPPSSLPSAAVLAEKCWNNYNRTVATPLPAILKDNLAELAKHFVRANLFNYFIDLIVPWHLFRADHNLGHAAIADFLAVNVLQSAISTNFDCLVEDAAQSLGRCDFVGSLSPYEVHGGFDRFNPLYKPHGCCIRQKHQTLWCSEQLSIAPIVKQQIEAFQNWLPTYLMNKDILITGFWSDWEYINDILFSSLLSSQPSRVILIDPSSTSSLSNKAPGLWSWVNSRHIWFRHISSSASDFLDELRRLISRIIFRNLFNDSISEYRARFGFEYSGPTDLDPVLSSDVLYSLRRNLAGSPSNEIIRTIEPRPEQKRFATTHLRLIALGARLGDIYYTHNSKTIRLIHAAGEVMSSIKDKFRKERAIGRNADITICAGASPDMSLPNIVRGSTAQTFVRSNITGDWITDEEYFSNYCAVTP